MREKNVKYLSVQCVSQLCTQKAKERMCKICVNPNLNKPPHSCLITILNSVYVDIIIAGSVNTCTKVVVKSWPAVNQMSTLGVGHFIFHTLVFSSRYQHFVLFYWYFLIIPSCFSMKGYCWRNSRFPCPNPLFFHSAWQICIKCIQLLQWQTGWYTDVKQRATSGASVVVVFTDPKAALG
jgi:hypothetical protein